MTIILLVALLLTVVALTVPMPSSAPTVTTTANVVVPSSTLYVHPTINHGLLRSVFVPEAEIRSYMAMNRAKVHSSAPTVGGYTVLITVPGANPFTASNR